MLSGRIGKKFEGQRPQNGSRLKAGSYSSHTIGSSASFS